MTDRQDDRRARVWQVVSLIPRGKVASYGQVARLAGLPGYARFVGHVMKNLPQDTTLPWHRVVNAQRSLSFPAGSPPWREQKERLEAEGLRFANDRLPRDCYWTRGDVGSSPT